jgi:hypothetical protein
MRMDYDVFSRSRAENTITHFESVVESRSIASNTGTITHVGKADPTKMLITVDYRSTTKDISNLSVRTNSKRYSPCR